VSSDWEWELLAGPATITEGPAWDGSGLFYTAIAENEIRRYDPETGSVAIIYEHTPTASSSAPTAPCMPVPGPAAASTAITQTG